MSIKSERFPDDGTYQKMAEGIRRLISETGADSVAFVVSHDKKVSVRVNTGIHKTVGEIEKPEPEFFSELIRHHLEYIHIRG